MSERRWLEVSERSDLREKIGAAEDSFAHMDGGPQFEPGINSSSDGEHGEVQIQKACRLLELAYQIDDVGDYWTAVLEQSFIAIEHTLQGYLLVITGADRRELQDHSTPYEMARGQVPLTDDTIDRLENLYEDRRTDHYYGTTVTTQNQAERMRSVARSVHEIVVEFDHETEQYCICSRYVDQ